MSLVALLATIVSRAEHCGTLDDAMREDLDVFETKVLANDVPYQRALKSGARGVDSIRDCPPISVADFELALAEILAQGKNGHSTVLTMRWPRRYNRLPRRALLLDDGLYLVGEPKSNDDCLVRAIDGHPMTEIRRVWSRHTGSPGGLARSMFHAFVESPELLHATGLAERPDRVRIDFANCPTETFAAVPPGDEGEGFSHSRLIELSAAGHTETVPTWLAEPDQPFRLLRLRDDVAYLQLRANAHPEVDIRGFAGAATAQLEDWNPRFVIFDQRLNLGGDLNTTRGLMTTLAKVTAPDGTIVALVSDRTFSAAIHNLAFLKQAAGARMTIIGKPVGDDLEFWSEGNVVELPHSSALFLYATERHNYRTGCPEDDCHPPIRNNPVAIDSIEPDIELDYTGPDFRAGRDPAMEMAFEKIDEAPSGD